MHLKQKKLSTEPYIDVFNKEPNTTNGSLPYWYWSKMCAHAVALIMPSLPSKQTSINKQSNFLHTITQKRLLMGKKETVKRAGTYPDGSRKGSIDSCAEEIMESIPQTA